MNQLSRQGCPAQEVSLVHENHSSAVTNDSVAKLRRFAERLRKAQAATDDARDNLRQFMRTEIAAGRLTKAGIARELGISRQRVQQMLSD